MRPFLSLASALLVVAGLAACNSGQGAPDSTSGPAGQGSEPQPMVSQAGPTTSSSGFGTLQFEMPSGWKSETPSSSMRTKQASIPGEAGPAEFSVFFFGPGQGGSVEANLARWENQVETAPGYKPTKESFDVGELKVTWIEVQGTLKPSNTGMGPSSPQSGAGLLGAVVEGPGGPWFFKATGPSATLTAQRDAFLGMLHSVHLG